MGDSEKFLQRYARQISLPEIGIAGQRKLGRAKVLMIGAGGLGAPAGYYLVAAGIGALGIMDGDVVDISNLQRQTAHATADIGHLKVESAAAKFRAINPETDIRPIARRLTPENAIGQIEKYDFVLDATDNFDSKFLIADACHATGKPYSHAGILRFRGQTMTVIPGRTACYRCVFERPPSEPAAPAPPQGPLGPVPGIIGAIQAGEAIKYFVGCGELLTNRILTFDLLSMQMRAISVRRNPACRLCRSILPDTA